MASKMTIKKLKWGLNFFATSQFCVVFFLRMTFSMWLQMVTTSSRFMSYRLQIQQKENIFYLRILKEICPGTEFQSQGVSLGLWVCHVVMQMGGPDCPGMSHMTIPR